MTLIAVITLCFASMTIGFALWFIFKYILHCKHIKDVSNRSTQLSKYQRYQLLAVLNAILLIISYALLIIMGRIISDYPRQKYGIIINLVNVLLFGLVFIFYTLLLLEQYGRIAITPSKYRCSIHNLYLRQLTLFIQLFPLVTATVECIVTFASMTVNFETPYRQYQVNDIRLYCKYTQFVFSVTGVGVVLVVETIVHFTLFRETLAPRNDSDSIHSAQILSQRILHQRMSWYVASLLLTDIIMTFLYFASTLWANVLPEYEAYCICSCWLILHIFAAFKLLELLMQGLIKTRAALKPKRRMISALADLETVSRTDIVEDGLFPECGNASIMGIKSLRAEAIEDE